MEQYVHFKGGRYQVLNLAEMEDTGEILVIYQALYGEGRIYARPLSSFVSEVDRKKYPDAAQYWRFRRVVPPEDEPALSRSAGNAQEHTACARPTEQSIARDAQERAVRGADLPAGKPSSQAARSSDWNSFEAPDSLAVRSSDRNGADDPAFAQDEPALAPAVLDFLDAETADERLGILAAARGTLTDEMIDTMAYALGIEVEPGPIDSRYLDLRECLLTISRYEMDRGRFRR